MTTPRPSWIREHLSGEERAVLIKAGLAALGIVGGILLFTHAAMSEPSPGRESDKPVSVSRARISQDANGNAVMIGGRPPGCPWKYCGCGLARHLGIEDRRLYRAWSWAEIFPRTSPSSGMAAVRRGHVMLLQSHVGGTRWIVRDYNGGRHLSWIHERDVRGYVFVNPHGAYAERRGDL